MTLLAEVSNSRDNHFNLIRMIAATVVLVSHAWLIANGIGTVEPLQIATGHSLGTLAVFVFFAVSGFFITASFDRARSRRDFLAARALRLLPALIVSTWLIALVMGPLVTSLPVGAYLTDPATWVFVLRNSLPLSLRFELPGVFDANPVPTPIGSIWTLPNEVACYAGVFLVGVLGLIRKRAVLSGVLAVYLAAWLWVEWGGVSLPGRVEALRVLSLPFAIGIAFYLWQAHIPIKGWLAAGLAIGLGLLAAALRHTPLYEPVLALAIAYITFWLAYLPGGWLHRYNRLGDYSYGTYLYAFPLQGLMVWLWGPMTPWTNILLALPVTLIFAVLSWRLVEKPALDLRARPAKTRARPAT